MDVLSLQEKFMQFTKYWHPYIIGELNDNYIKLAKLKGDFIWHKHENEDELFIVIEGVLTMEFRDRTVNVGQGEILVVPKGVEHKPYAASEVKVMLIEPKQTLHTGDIKSDLTVENLEWI